MAPLGFDPRTIDAMEVWEAASILRRYEDEDEEAGPPERDLVAERMAYAEAVAAFQRGEGPEPEPPQPDPPRPDAGLPSSLGVVDLGLIE